ncbi:AsmA family protein [Parahaliea aestuarii]|uniref:AsmA family protein n=1 Tax=Parahaliea aestuarii TaxID=1852021 RepID=A0A5C8ZUW3_9GAMM|nr:AsmA family protein [Parahaliea aestuarii]TXS91609.1 AsmA family protein [Parahaliea aestuarii]
MTALKILLSMVLALALLLGGLLAWLHFADLTAHRSWLGAMIGNTIGRELRLQGDIDVDVWPELRLAVTQVSLANADWGSEPWMASVGQTELALRTASLWQRGPIEVRLASASNVDVLLESGPDGQSNLPIVSSESDADVQEAGGGIGVVLEKATFANLRVRRRSAQEEAVYTLSHLQLRADGNDQLQIEGEGRVREQPLRLSGRIGTRRQLASGGSIQYQLALQLGDADMILKGRREVPRPDVDGTLQLRLQVEGVPALLQALAVPLQLDGQVPSAGHLTADLRVAADSFEGALEAGFGELTLTTQLRGADNRLEVNGDIDNLQRLASIASVQGLPELPLVFAATLERRDHALAVPAFSLDIGGTKLEGRGSFAAEGVAGNFELDARGEMASELSPLLPELPFQLSTTLELDAGGLQLAPLSVRLGDSDLVGEASLGAASDGQRGALTAELVSKQIDLLQLLAVPAGPAETREGKAEPAAEPAAAAPYVFGEKRLPLAALRGNRVQIRWMVEELVTQFLVLEDVDLQAVLQDERLEITGRVVGADGGEGHNRLVLEAGKDQPRLTLRSQLRDFRVNLASGEVQKAEDIPPLSLSLDLNASGASPRELAASSAGEALLTMGPGLLTNSLMQTFSSDLVAQLVAALNPFSKTETHMQFQCGVIALLLEKGLANIDPVTIQTEKLQVVASGEVDLSDEAINMVFNTKPRKGVGVSADMFVTPFVSLEGTLAAPRMGLDEKGTLLTAGAAMATGGMSILWKGMMDRATGTIDHCKEEELQKYAHPPLD